MLNSSSSPPPALPMMPTCDARLAKHCQRSPDARRAWRTSRNVVHRAGEHRHLRRCDPVRHVHASAPPTITILSAVILREFERALDVARLIRMMVSGSRPSTTGIIASRSRRDRRRTGAFACARNPACDAHVRLRVLDQIAQRSEQLAARAVPSRSGCPRSARPSSPAPSPACRRARVPPLRSTIAAWPATTPPSRRRDDARDPALARGSDQRRLRIEALPQLRSRLRSHRRAFALELARATR